jgi:two-component system, NtrC family, response regulator
MRDFTIHQGRIMTALTEISKLFSSSLDYREVANQCLHTLSETLDLERGTLLMPTSDRKFLVIKVSIGFSPEETRSAVYKIGDDFVGKVFSNCLPMALPDADEMPGIPIPKDNAEAFNLYRIGFIAVPVILDSRPIGVITAHRTSRSSTMVDEDIRVMKIVASLLSQTLRIAEMIREENSRLVQENKELHAELEERFNPDNLISNSSAMSKTLAMVKRVSGTDASVLLRGESGTGKTLLARSIHYSSPRQKAPFVIVNCAALPSGLIESELFGHEKGAFTGAIAKKIGKIEYADGGTLFLDEIGDMPLALQAKLLRFLQERTIERVGGREEIPVDVRVVCATNKNLQQMVKDGTFREDLYYRICEMEIHIPPLRDRQGDKLLLARHFLRKYSEQNNPAVSGFSQEAVESIETHEWPGNIREMENRVKRAVVMCEEKNISSVDLGLLSSDGVSINLRQVRLQAERNAIIRALAMTENNISAAARMLGVTRPTLYDLLKKYNVNLPGEAG